MKRYWTIAVIAFISLGLATVVLALSGPTDVNKPFNDDKTPKILQDTVNSLPRVAGWGQSRVEPGITGSWTFYYQGKTEQLNHFLERLSKLSLDKNKLSVSISPEAGRTNFGFPGGKEFNFNWSITFFGYKEFQSEIITGWNVDVEVHIHGDIDITELKLPLAYKAELGGKAAEFVSLHNDRHKHLAEKLLAGHLDSNKSSSKPSSTADTQPTTYGMGEAE